MSYGVVAIVRNELGYVEKMLDSAWQAGATVATIVDTGSTDGTWEWIQSQVSDPYQRPFIDFGTTRSEAFKLARGTADWLLALDADMTVEIDDDFIPSDDVDAYMIRLTTGTWEYRLPLLLKGSLPWVSVGVVHEYTMLADGTLGRRENTDKVRIVHHGWARQADPKRRIRYHTMLKAEYQKNRYNPRTIFYLAQSYLGMGMKVEAKRLYDARVLYTEHPQEQWYSRYQSAMLEKKWPERCAGLLTAWGMRPARLEPLYELVRELNQRQAYAAAYVLSDVPLAPTGDDMFVNKAVWDWGMMFEHALAAWYTGRYDEFEVLSNALLTVPSLPDSQRAAVIANLAKFGRGLDTDTLSVRQSD